MARGRKHGSRWLPTYIAEYKKDCEQKAVGLPKKKLVDARKFIQHFWFLLFVTYMHVVPYLHKVSLVL